MNLSALDAVGRVRSGLASDILDSSVRQREAGARLAVVQQPSH